MDGKIVRIATLGTTWLLYDGGMHKGYREQTENFVEIMKQESRRTDLEVVDSVKRFYYGAVLAARTAKSGYFPKLALTGELFKWWNDYDAGMATDRNKDGWNIGIGVQIPLFNGFLTKSKVDETRGRVAKIKEEQILLREGLGLQIKDIVLSLNAAQKTYQATLDAMTASAESRDLNTRAYQNELVETEDVVEAQLMEALMSARHYKASYEHVALLSRLNLVVGTEVLAIFIE